MNRREFMKRTLLGVGVAAGFNAGVEAIYALDLVFEDQDVNDLGQKIDETKIEIYDAITAGNTGEAKQGELLLIDLGNQRIKENTEYNNKGGDGALTKHLAETIGSTVIFATGITAKVFIENDETPQEFSPPALSPTEI